MIEKTILSFVHFVVRSELGMKAGQQRCSIIGNLFKLRIYKKKIDLLLARYIATVVASVVY